MPTPFRISPPGCLKKMCTPPPPVLEVNVFTEPCCCSKSRQLPSPPWRGSMSMTTRLLSFPVAMPGLARGHFRPHSSMVALSVVASFTPCLVNGCFPGLLQFGLPQVHTSSLIVCNGKTEDAERLFQYADEIDRDNACLDIVESLASVDPLRARAYFDRIEDRECKENAVVALRAGL